MSMQQIQQLYVLSKTGKVLVRKEDEKECLISFKTRDELAKFLAGFDFSCFIQEDHITTINREPFNVALEYRVYLVEEEDDMHHSDYIWKKAKTVEIVSDDNFSFRIDVSALTQGENDYIRQVDKNTKQMVKNCTNDDLFSYTRKNSERLNLRTNFKKNFTLMILTENDQILRRNKNNKFLTQRSLDTCLKLYAFDIQKRVDIEYSGKNYSLVWVKDYSKNDWTYKLDSLLEEEMLIVEKAKNKTTECEDK